MSVPFEHPQVSRGEKELGDRWGLTGAELLLGKAGGWGAIALVAERLMPDRPTLTPCDVP